MTVKSGYFKKSLHVDLTAARCERRPLSDEFLARYVGGRGFSAKLVWDHLVAHDFKIDPLGPENLLVIAPGPLTGACLPSSGKCSFVAISPATGVYGDSSIGGTLGMGVPPGGDRPVERHRPGSATLDPIHRRGRNEHHRDARAGRQVVPRSRGPDQGAARHP